MKDTHLYGFFKRCRAFFATIFTTSKNQKEKTNKQKNTKSSPPIAAAVVQSLKLSRQIPPFWQFLHFFNFPCLGSEGIEFDHPTMHPPPETTQWSEDFRNKPWHKKIPKPNQGVRITYLGRQFVSDGDTLEVQTATIFYRLVVPSFTIFNSKGYNHHPKGVSPFWSVGWGWYCWFTVDASGIGQRSTSWHSVCWYTAWWFQPIWKIWSSNWKFSPNRGEHKQKSLSCHHLVYIYTVYGPVLYEGALYIQKVGGFSRPWFLKHQPYMVGPSYELEESEDWKITSCSTHPKTPSWRMG